MTELNCFFESEEKKAAFAAECEKDFEARLSAVSSNIIGDNAKIIALSGPSCSGKTTTAAKLTSDLTKSGYDVHLVSIDNFFRQRDVLDREAIMRDGNIDYDSVDAIDLELLSERAASIISGKPTDIPVYDFTLGKCTHYENIKPSDRSVFIFEGIQAIYPEVTALFGENYKSVYISVEDDVTVNGVYFTKREIRLLRRLIRDCKFRGAAPEFTFFLWRSVTANEDRSILPYAGTADIKINSFMPYEIFLMRGFIPKLLSLVPENNPYFPRAYEISKRLSELPEISEEYVPKTSMLREFIG